jgi:hypothetical protein
MIDLTVLIALVLMHFVADFVFQTDKIAINKGHNNWILAKHVFFYALPFLWFGWLFALVNFVLHFATDYCTSRLSGYFWQRDERHWFFVTIGADQAIHMICLFATYVWLVG